MPSYCNFQYLFHVSYRNILPVAGILISNSVLKSRIKPSSFKTPSFLLTVVYGAEGIVQAKEGDRGIRNPSTHHGVSGRDRMFCFFHCRRECLEDVCIVYDSSW
jgi:hypothetical protein